jgi:holo-[acyl-carrier protein] synthase
MIGCDIVNMNRFAARQDRWARRVLTERELAEYEQRTNKLEYLAGRWAAKESIYKAAGIVSGFDVLTGPAGKPYVTGVDHIIVSISHEKTHAIAVALINNV